MIQNRFPNSLLLAIQPGTTVVLVFDTDVPKADVLRENIKLLKRYCVRIKLIHLGQVLNLEDELVRCTDAKAVAELTKSEGTQKFKTDFCRMKSADCRAMLERHHIDVSRLWTTALPNTFQAIEQNGIQIKV